MDLEQEIKKIQDRNQRVEADKKWEVSLVRRGSITVLTYFFAVLWLVSIGNAYPFLNAVIPAAGYFLSTLTLTIIKTWWQK
ncbi:hypothetical protein HZC00_02200 [Candidatus Kaiserbacteria bacterium]|nr:hypothetical protein [Candidatus Kaiserbacteria bacterium]